MEQEVKNIKYRGISRALSDMSISDGGCAESVNVSVRNGDVSVICPPEEVEQLPKGIKYDLIYIHRMFSNTEYIGKMDNGIGVVNGNPDASCFNKFFELDSDETLNDINSIGNVLIISTNRRMLYFIYKSDDIKYNFLGSKLPEVQISFSSKELSSEDEPVNSVISITYLFNSNDVSYGDEYIYDHVNKEMPVGLNPYHQIYDGTFDMDSKSQNSVGAEYSVFETAQSMLTNEIRNNMAKINSAVAKKGHYNRPFFVRYAIQMYDGNYIMQSSPILVSGDIKNVFWNISHVNAEPRYGGPKIHIDSHSYSLVGEIKYNPEIEKWKDIIKSIDIFISDPMDTTMQKKVTRMKNGKVEFEPVTDKEMENLVLGTSNFYRIRQILINDFKSDLIIDFSEDLKIYAGDLLPTQPRLEDGYKNLHQVIAHSLFLYNNRINSSLLDIDFYEGAPYFTSRQTYRAANNDILPANWHFTYYIKGQDGQTYKRSRIIPEPKYYYIDESDDNRRPVEGAPDGKILSNPGAWYTYPDPNCFALVVTNDRDGKRWVIKMHEHPRLNCAYAFIGFGNDITILEESDETIDGSETNENVTNELRQSEVNNPFVFKPENIHTLPVNKILGMTTNTQPVSQGQFGQYPIYVFTDNGVWAIQVQSDGTYMSAAPLSRDVCINPKSITGIEGAVIFITQRGVMILSSSQIRCISDDMIGRHFDISDLDRADMAIRNIAAREWQTDVPELVSDDMPFMDYMKGCFVAYDYGNRRLVFTNGASYYQYVYDLASGTWHKMCFSKKFKRTLNSYPECYLQEDGDTSDTVYDFSVISDTNAVTDRHFGLIITRAFDLGNPSALKRIDRILNMGDYENGKVRCLLYGSNDYVRFVPVNSLKGSSYKSYRLVLFMDMLPSENVAMTTIGFTTRWDKRLR